MSEYCLEHRNLVDQQRAHPFVWTKTGDEILRKAKRPTASNSDHWLGEHAMGEHAVGEVESGLSQVRG